MADPVDANLDAVLADLDKAAKEREAMGAAAVRIRTLTERVAELEKELKVANREIARLEKPPERPPELSIEEAKEAQRLFRALAGSLDNYLHAKVELLTQTAAAATAKAVEDNPIPGPRNRRDLSQPWTDPAEPK